MSEEQEDMMCVNIAIVGSVLAAILAAFYWFVNMKNFV